MNKLPFSNFVFFDSNYPLPFINLYCPTEKLDKFLSMWPPCMKRFIYLEILLVWLIQASFNNALGARNNTIQCINKERDTLLEFKHEIRSDHCGLLTSWDSQLDCCQWHGISCDNLTGHVISLDRRGTDILDPCLKGKISPSIVELKYLKYLDLSSNDFGEQSIPSFIGSIHSLKYLNLSFNNYGREIPHQLANLTSLTSLDLSYNDGGLHVKNLGWLSHLKLLKDIDLSEADLSLAEDWLQILNGLPFLRSVRMDLCSLSLTSQSLLSYKNFSTTIRVISLTQNNLNDSSIFQWVSNFGIEYLDLSDNTIPGPIPTALGNMHSLSYLDLSRNSLEGLVPGSFSKLISLVSFKISGNNFQGILFSDSPGSLCSLQELDLSGNNFTSTFSSILQFFSGCENMSLVSLDVSENRFWGSIPDSISSFSLLQTLSLANNQLKGTITPSFVQLSMLMSMDFSSNSLEGTLSNHHLSNLSRLTYLDLSNNLELMVNMSDDWIPPFKLRYIGLNNCKLGPRFPKWLLTQMDYFHLDISNSGIYDIIPTSFWKTLQPDLQFLNISHNGIHGVLPNMSMTTFDPDTRTTIDLSYNLFEGAIPSFLGYVGVLFLNDNNFHSSIAPLCPNTKSVMVYLDLSNNFLSGELPNCWGYFDQLLLLSLNNNNFTGKLPPSFGALNLLEWLTMRNNHINGELRVLANCTSLAVLDLGYNSFTGYVQPGIWSGLTSLQVLDLRMNNLSGGLPSSLCQLTSLQVLDLSFNHISGSIPNCICNLQGMEKSNDTTVYLRSFYGRFYIPQPIMWKQKEQNFSSNLGLVRSISISNNDLEGEIPSEISCLIGLVSLDLARNNLTGSIPSKVGELTFLEFLDLSSNHLSGRIPSSLADLNFLSGLDLSYNNLSGMIPTSIQLRDMDLTSYMGNPGLCGPPLEECGGRLSSPQGPKGINVISAEENDGGDIFPGLYISVVLGFIVGLWGVCGCLMIKSSWRYALFGFVEDANDILHVMIARAWRRP